LRAKNKNKNRNRTYIPKYRYKLVLQIILRRVCGERIDISLFDAIAMLADAADATKQKPKAEFRERGNYIDV